MKAYLLILLIISSFFFSCKKEIRTDNVNNRVELMLLNSQIAEIRERSLSCYYNLKHKVQNFQDSKDLVWNYKADSLFKEIEIFSENLDSTIIKKPRANNLLIYADFIYNTYEKQFANTGYYDEIIKDSTFTIFKVVQNNYIQNKNDLDSIRLLYLTSKLELNLIGYYSNRMGTICLEMPYLDLFKNNTNYHQGDTVILSGTMENKIKNLTNEFSIKDSNTTVINMSTNEALNYSISYIGPIVSLRFVPNKKGVYYVKSDIYAKALHQKYLFGYLRDSIRVE